MPAMNHAGEAVTFKRPDGQSAPGHAFHGPGPEAPAIVLIQEWWGINAQIRGVARRLADAGHSVLLPDFGDAPVVGTGGYVGAWGRILLSREFATVGSLILLGSLFAARLAAERIVGRAL